MWQKGSALLISILISALIIAGISIYQFQGGWVNKPTDSGYKADIDYAKDVQIQADFKAIQTALESYHLKEQRYPDNLNELVSVSLLSKVSRNPYTNSDYNYQATTQSYTLSTKLGNGTDFVITN